MGIITTIYVVAFSCFSHRVLRVFHKHLLHLQIFSVGFSKIVFILYEVQALKGECYKTYVCVHFGMSRQPPCRCVTRRAPTEPSRPYTAALLR
jgi:hypothetical protein